MVLLRKFVKGRGTDLNFIVLSNFIKHLSVLISSYVLMCSINFVFLINIWLLIW